MAHELNRLTARKVATEKRPGKYADGGLLYLNVDDSGTKSWCVRYMLAGKRREMGLGGISAVSLADARRKAVAVRALLADGVDPLARRASERAAKKLEAARAMTFDECAAAYIKAHSPSWDNAKHRKQWESTLAAYVTPIFGAVAVSDVDVGMVMKAVQPIWTTKPPTAKRVRGRIESVLDWAKARGYRTGENPARWRGHLSNLLPAPAKIHRPKHHAALPYTEIGAFMAHLKTMNGAAARALEFAILTAARSGEVLGARWPEINFATRVWTVPADRMKARREHRVPLSGAALKVLEQAKADGGEHLFVGSTAGLSNSTLFKVLVRMGRTDITPHGFRSAFRDWAAERTNFTREVAEAALAHVFGDATERAYKRGDVLEKRRRLMEAWAQFCEPKAGIVVAFGRS
jgi:integrase